MRNIREYCLRRFFCFAMLLLLAAGLWWYRPRRAERYRGACMSQSGCRRIMRF